MEPIVITLTEDICNDPQKLYNTLNETAKKLISTPLRQYFSDETKRNDLINEHGDRAFMIPSKHKFPVINPLTGKFCNPLIEAVKIRAFINDYPKVLEEVNHLCRKVKCSDYAVFKFPDSDEEYNLFEVLETLDVNFESDDIEKDDNDSQEYKELFERLLQKHGVSSISEFKTDEEKKKFFDEVDAKWQSDKEKDKSETYTEHFDVTLTSFNVESINELDLGSRRRFLNLVESKW